MAKKFFDILPPKKIKAKEKVFEKEKTEFKIPRPQEELPKFYSQKTLTRIKWIFIPLFVLISIFLISFKFSKAEIEIWPETETLNLDLKLRADEKIEKVDIRDKAIPAKIFEAEETVSAEFPATGKKLLEERAEGTIRIYNKYSVHKQVLVATTRFLSADGKLFRTPTRVTVPGASYERERLVPGQIDIKVRADQPGPEFNIEPTTFSIPGFAGTGRYAKIYARSFQPMTGGARREVSQVTKEDIEKAKNDLSEKASHASKLALRERIPLGFNFYQEHIESEILETFSTAEPGAQLERFVFRAKAKAKTMAFRKEDLESFVQQLILNQIPADKKLYQPSLRINYSLDKIDLKLGKIFLNLNLEAKIYSDVDTLALKEALAGKSLNESQVFLENQPEIPQAEIRLWPFWLKRVPSDIERIKINLRID